MVDWSCCRPIYFNPRSPWGERQTFAYVARYVLKFQSTLPVGGATRTLTTKLYTGSISIHAPRGGSDTSRIINSGSIGAFQSTLPVGGATGNPRGLRVLTHISIHAPRGGSDVVSTYKVEIRIISIHAPRGGSDHVKVPAAPAGFISIHAPRGGSDVYDHAGEKQERHFNPRSPWGERLVQSDLRLYLGRFQSTLPVGGATKAN